MNSKKKKYGKSFGKKTRSILLKCNEKIIVITITAALIQIRAGVALKNTKKVSQKKRCFLKVTVSMEAELNRVLQEMRNAVCQSFTDETTLRVDDEDN